MSTARSESSVWCGNLDTAVTEDLLHELFQHAGPVQKVTIPKDKVAGARQNFAFIEFEQPMDADYACKIMANVKLFNKPLKLSRSANQKATLDQSFHAKLFIGNLDQSIDEHTLYELFVQFGAVLSAKLMTEPDSDTSRGFGFVQFDSFESADAAIAAMDGQYIANRPIHVNYAFKPNSKGERHGTEEERELERQSKEAMGSVSIRPTLSSAPASANISSMPNMSNVLMIPPPPPQTQSTIPIMIPQHQPIQPIITQINQPIRLTLPQQQPLQFIGHPQIPPPLPIPYSLPYSMQMQMPPGFASSLPTPPGYPAR